MMKNDVLGKSYLMTLATMLPYTTVFFGTHATCMKYFRATPKLSHQETLSNILAGTMAGFLASSLSVPMDVVKTRVQLSEGNEGIFRICKKIWISEGTKGFMRGYQSRVVIMTPLAATNFVIFDIVKYLSAKKQ
jgi:hypothetical protein